MPGSFRKPKLPKRAVVKPAVKPRKKETFESAQRRRYAPVNYSKGPATYRSAKGYDLLYGLGGFRKGGNYSIADFACGQGLVGREVANRLLSKGINFGLSFFDVVPEQLAKIPKTPRGKSIVSDIRKISFKSNSFTTGFCRYAIKNLPFPQQIEALKEINRVIKKGGVFVLQDMVSPEGLKEFQNAERLAKNAAAGDFVTRNNVPTEKEWVSMLKSSGFAVEKVARDISIVNTQDWVNSSQLSQVGLSAFRGFIESARQKWPSAWREYKIERVGGGYKITYPIVIFKCRKE